jgi:chromosome segregation ATPase
MDNSQLTIQSLSNQSVQGTQGHHHHHKKSIADQIKDMESTINNLASSGKLTSDQASAMTKELDDIKNTLNPTSSATSQTGNATQLSADDRQKIKKELHDIGKQLFQALNPQSSASSTQQSNGVDAIFQALDTNGDGAISKDELTSFLSNLTSGAANNANGLAAGNFTYSEQATFSISESQSTFETTA